MIQATLNVPVVLVQDIGEKQSRRFTDTKESGSRKGI